MNSQTPRTTFSHDTPGDAGEASAARATMTIAAPTIQASQAAASEVDPSTQGEMNSQAPTSTFSQLCQRVHARISNLLPSRTPTSRSTDHIVSRYNLASKPSGAATHAGGAVPAPRRQPAGLDRGLRVTRGTVPTGLFIV